MRLWHKDLIPLLPRQQLFGQWRECCLVARQIATNGTPNHILVNRIMDYTIDQFIMYGHLVYDNLRIRGYNAHLATFDKYFNQTIVSIVVCYPMRLIFDGWHDDVYLRECLYNLEEKARAGGIPSGEWKVIYERYKDFTPLWKGVNNEDN